MRTTKKFLESLLKENEILGDNLHKLTEVDGETIEMKYCPKCMEWHRVTDFTKSTNTKDGLFYCCRKCQRKYAKRRYEKKKSKSQEIKDVTPPIDNIKMEKMEYYDDVFDILYKMQQRDEERQREIRSLEEENKVLKDRKIDLTSLSKEEIEKVLKFNKVEPRLLFHAIARQDDRYSFYAIDKTTGLKSHICLDKEVA